MVLLGGPRFSVTDALSTKDFMSILKLDEAELRSRRAFYEIADEDLERLAGLRAQVENWTDGIVEDFYALLIGHPETRAILHDRAQVERLKRLQRDYFLGLFAGRCDLAYVEDRLRVGAAHERIGLAPKWYIGAYRRYLQLVHDRLYAALPQERAELAFSSVMKLVAFDKSLAIDTYIAAHLETIGRHQVRLAHERAARDEAEDAQRWLTTTLRSIGDGVVATNAEGRVVMMNPIAERLTGYTASEARGRRLSEVLILVDEETGEPIASSFDRVLHDGILGNKQNTILISRSGSRTPIADSGAPIRDPQGHVHGVVLVFRDATEQKKELERQRFLAKATSMMASSLDYTETLVRVANLAIPKHADWCEIHVLDPDTGELKQVALAHADPQKLDVARAFRARAPTDVKATRGTAQVLRTGRTRLIAELKEERLSSWDGSEESVALLRELKPRSIIIVPIAAGAFVFGTITFAFAESDRRYDERDAPFFEELGRRAAMVMENARLYGSEQRARQAADEANRSKDMFLATVSHELRTPLSAILGWSKMLIRHSLDETKRARALASIERSAVAMAKLIEDLLDFSRIVSGKLRIDPSVVDLADVVAKALESVTLAADAKGIHVISSIERGTKPYVGDPSRLQQIVWNLVSNAVKFTPQGGVVRVALRPLDDVMEITVSDTGVGIEPSFLPLLFDPFRQAGAGISRGTVGGLGLGLAITKRLVELHGGTITGTSEGLGRGATFVVKLPNNLRVEAFRKPPSPPVPPPQRPDAIARLDGLRVLVVEDDDETRELLRAVLEQFGARAQAVASVKDAMTALDADGPPDVLLSDIGMPEETGYDLIRRVRARPPDKGGNVAAAALTAYTRPEDRKTALDAGYTLHVSKPIDPVELVRVVKKLGTPQKPTGAPAALP